MSETLTKPKITAPSRAADAKAIQEFKDRFNTGQANALTGARQDRSSKQATAVGAQEACAEAERLATIAANNHKNLKSLREGKRVVQPAGDKEVQAEQMAKDLAAAIPAARKKAVDSAKELADAERALERLERQAYKDKVRVLVKRLQAAGQGGGDLEKQLWASLNDAIETGTLPDLEAVLATAEERVIEAVSGVELEPRRKLVDERITSLAAGSAKDVQQLDKIRKRLKTATLLEIEKTIEPTLDELEDAANDAESSLSDLGARIEQLKTQAVPKVTVSKLLTDLEATAKSAVTNLSKALTELGTLRTNVEKAESDAVRAVQCRTRYPVLLKAVNDQVAAFPDKGFLPGNLRQILAVAQQEFDQNAFIPALVDLQELDTTLKVQAAKAAARVLKRDAETQSASDRKLQQDLAEAQRLQDEADQRTAEEAMVPASLEAIGRDRNFGVWYNKVETLLNAGLVTITCGAVITLPGGTTDEVVVSVTAADGTRTFVVHYHKGARAATTRDPYASRFHTKPYRGNARTPRIYVNDDNWIFQFAPRINQL